MRSGAGNRPRQRGNTWTADRLAKLEQLRSAGETAQTIAQQIGLSRSAVMGKLFRLQRAGEQPRVRKKTGKKSAETPDQKLGKSLLELTNESCRWPIGNPASDKFHFCGVPEADFEQDVPYCAHHMQRAYVAGALKKPNEPNAFNAWHAISPGITETVRRMFRDAISRKEWT